MPRIVQRRHGRGWEREIQTLTRLRTAIVIDERLDSQEHARILAEIDALIKSLSGLIKSDLQPEGVRTHASRVETSSPPWSPSPEKKGKRKKTTNAHPK
jgi:hypothetical protein